MNLYLVRHGDAKREEEDPKRPLTEKGFDEVKAVAFYLQKLGIKVKRIFHSGKLRAFQTAEILAQALNPEEGLQEADGLAPMDEPEVWADRVKNINENLMLVGHLPHLERLASLLLCGEPERNILNLKSGGILCLKRRENQSWYIEWMISPDILK